MEKIVIYTQAYNAENTLQRTIDSVRLQSYTNWIWVIIDNASTDRTGNIIIENAIMDSRIIPYRMKVNNLSMFVSFWLLLKKNFPNDFFMHLDADDTIEPECFETLIKFIKEEVCDIVACGTEFVSDSADVDCEVIKERKLERDLILEGEGFAKNFRKYRSYTNEVWGKLYRFSALNEDAFALVSSFYYDTQLVLKLFQYAKRVGIMGKILHRAHVSRESLTHQLDGIGHRISYRQDMNWTHLNTSFLTLYQYLKSYGEISHENMDYLCAIYIGWIQQNLMALYMTFGGSEGPLVYMSITGFLESDIFQKVFSHKPISKEYRNLSCRKDILSQMYYYLMLCEYNSNTNSYVKTTQEKVKNLMMKVPE